MWMNACMNLLLGLQVLPAGECHPGRTQRHHSDTVQPLVRQDGGGKPGERKPRPVQHSGVCGLSGGGAGLHALLHQRWDIQHSRHTLLYVYFTHCIVRFCFSAFSFTAFFGYILLEMKMIKVKHCNWCKTSDNHGSHISVWFIKIQYSYLYSVPTSSQF